MNAPANLVLWGQPSFPHGECDPRVLVGTRLVYERVRQFVLEVERRRAELDITWSEVSHLTGISEPTIRNVRRGVTWPDIRTFVQLCDMFGIHQLLMGSGREDLDGEWTPFEAAMRLPSVDPESMQVLGLEGPVGLSAVGDGLIDLALSRLAGRRPLEKHCWRCEVLLEFWGDMNDKTLCEELGGPGPEEGWWPFILERWDERVAARQPYAKRARADAQRLRAICDRVERQRHVLAYEAPSLGDDRESGGQATGG